MLRKPDAPTAERDIKRLILLELGSRPDITLRNNPVGLFYNKPTPAQLGAFFGAARKAQSTADLSKLVFRTLLGRPVKVGVPGEPDIIGWWTREFTETWTVNAGGFNPVERTAKRRWARSFAIEVKTEDGRLRPDQEQWRDHFIAGGGLYVLARSPADVRDVFDPKRRD